MEKWFIIVGIFAIVIIIAWAVWSGVSSVPSPKDMSLPEAVFYGLVFLSIATLFGGK